MSELLRIEVFIAGRRYPMKIKASEEEGIRRSAKKIEGQIREIEKMYGTEDRQDALAMCILNYASELEEKNSIIEKSVVIDNERVAKLIKTIDDHLTEF